MKLNENQIDLLIEGSKDAQLGSDDCHVSLVTIADLPSRFGDFQICAFITPCDEKEHTAIIKGNILDKEGVLVRLHSECLTGDVLGSKRCDCRDQLIESMNRIDQAGEGVLVYLRQEGRNIGLTEKIKAYRLQDMGLDTVQANIALGYEVDERDYAVAANILRSLRMKSVRLLTNNPDKIAQLTAHGTNVIERVPLILPPTEYNQDYLLTKERSAGHLLGTKADIRSVEEIRRITAISAEDEGQLG